MTLCDGSIVNEAVLFKSYCVADGAVRFSRIRVGRGAVLEPQAALSPGSIVPPHAVFKAMAIVTDQSGLDLGDGMADDMLTSTVPNHDYAVYSVSSFMYFRFSTGLAN